MIKFSVATTRSWKDDKGEWKDKTQWHNVVAYGNGFAQLASRFSKGAHVFVQGELTTREYDRTIQVPSGKKTIEHVIPQLVVELKADTVRILDRSSSRGAGELKRIVDHARRGPQLEDLFSQLREVTVIRPHPGSLSDRHRAVTHDLSGGDAQCPVSASELSRWRGGRGCVVV